MGRFVITIPPISIARELWRFGEPALSEQAAVLTASQAADIGERAGILHQSGEASRMWPGGPSGVTPAVMLAAIEYLEGTARPCGRSRRLPEKQLPENLQATEDELWAASEPVSREMDSRLHGPTSE
jgi:hypothetical protein